MSLLHYLSYAAILAAFAFVTLSLASGLLYVSELIEEHSRLAKMVGQRGICAIIALHAVLYFSESLPFPQIAFSSICHIVYLQNFSSTWPLISLTSLSFMSSCILVIADHFLWFFYFARVSQEARHTAQRTYHGTPTPNVLGFPEIATFFGICVWLAPLFLFLSLSANDNALPLSSSDPGSPVGLNNTPRVSLFRSLFSMTRIQSKPRRESEGLIAPRSPSLPPRSPLIPNTPNTPSRRSSLMAPTSQYDTLSPPRSPGANPIKDMDSSHIMNAGNFRLGTPPRQTARRATGEMVGLGLRRATGSPAIGSDKFY